MLYLCLIEPPTAPNALRRAVSVEAETERLASLGFVLSSRRRRREAIGSPQGITVWVRRAAWTNAEWTPRLVRVTSNPSPNHNQTPLPKRTEGAA